MKIYLAIPYSGLEEESFKVANRGDIESLIEQTKNILIKEKIIK